MKFKVHTLILLVSFFSLTCEEDQEDLSGTGIVNFAITELREVENTTSPLTIYIGIDSFNHMGGTVTVSVSGADYGSDYETSGGSSSFDLEVAPQGLSTSFSIMPIDDDLIEQDKVLTIAITSASGALELGSSTSLQFTILENDDPMTAMVGFASEQLQVQENTTEAAQIMIPFDQASTNGGSISIVASGAAVYNTDYTITGQTSTAFEINVPAGATEASFSIEPIDNALFEEDREIIFEITDVSGGLTLGANISSSVVIVNDDASPNPVIDFSAANTLSYMEDAGTITLNFELSEATSADATITLTASGTADASDFNFNGSTDNPYSFVIPSGSSSASVSIDIMDDSKIEEEESIILNITEVSGGLDAGLNLQQQTITIADNDQSSFAYVETFENATDLESLGYQAFILPTQDLPDSKLFKFNENAGKYSDVDDVTLPSDTGLVVFYNTTQNGNGVLDNVLITSEMEASGDLDVSIDIAYSQAPDVNNAVVTFYYSETYDGSASFNESDWTVMGTETAQSMDAEGFSTNNYKRKAMSISTSSNFYLAVRVNQTIDDTFTKTQWRLDNFKINN